ncbi:MAG: HAD-IA family hydrolase [Halieaceae bacterium]
MSSTIKVITFDLDNTLWDVEPVLLRAEQAQYHWLQENRERVTRQFDAEGLRRFRFRAYELHPELAHQISELRVQALYEAQLHCGYAEDLAMAGARQAFEAFLHVRHQVEPYERALEVLEELAQRFSLGALSNGNADVYKVDIGEYFDFAFSAEQVDASKPLPDMFHAGMQASGAASHEIIHVGDNPEHDVAGAQRLGMYTIWMNGGRQDWPGGEPADEEISSLQQLPQAIERIGRRAAQRQVVRS